MKRTRTPAFWTALGIFVLSLLGISTTLVLANQAAPPAAEDTLVADSNRGPSGQDLYAAPLSTTTPVTMYLPLVSRDFFVPFSYEDNFSNRDSGWPYGAYYLEWGYKTDGDGSDVYHLRMNSKLHNTVGFVTAPSYVAGNFDYTAIGRHMATTQPKQWYDQYGIVISTDPLHPGGPAIKKAYTFCIRLKMGDSYRPSWVIAKWNTPIKDDKQIIVEREDTLHISQTARVWNIFRVDRVGDELIFYLKYDGSSRALEEVYRFSDPDLPAALYFGFYGAMGGYDHGEYWMEYQFDYVGTHSKPN